MFSAATLFYFIYNILLFIFVVFCSLVIGLEVLMMTLGLKYKVFNDINERFVHPFIVYLDKTIATEYFGV
jgi:hypothetical protein